ncbi:hypothetical protein M9H77_28297 [Catharanthus roseus]|uniref:Uncharacterized protein n=1 Tax=Catharanthus roseus TaxID=4058 RepID=A0ACC0AH76_CATRO|nr:hypothetical protein M9H77_28297 [Catharanthus roseus]
MKVNTYLIVTRCLSSRTSDRQSYVTLGCGHGGANKPRTKLGIDDEEEEVQVKRRGLYGTKKCGCPFKLKADIKASLEFSKSKEKFNVKSNQILRIVSNKISHLALKKIWLEISRAVERIDDPKNKCRHYMRTSHDLPCSFREIRRLTKGVLSPVLPEDLGVTLTSPPEIQKSRGSGSGSGSGSDSGSGLWSGSGSRGRGRPSRAPRGRGRGCSRGRSSLSSVIDPSPYFTFPYTNAFPTFIYPFIKNWKNVIGDRNCSYRVVADFVVSLVLRHVLPLYLYSDRPGGTLVIGLLMEQQHFIQFYRH